MVLQLIKLLAAWTVSTPLFNATLEAVKRWEDDHLARLQDAHTKAEQRAAGRLTQDHVIRDLELAGFIFTTRVGNFAIELALQYLQRAAK